jgi:hypothetical protein
MVTMDSCASAKHRGTIRLIVGLFLLTITVAPVGAAQLTKEGRPVAVLVVPDSSAQAGAAAERIQRILAQMSGARLEIIRESAPRPAGLLPVYVGQTRFAASSGIQEKDLRPEEVVLVVTDEHVLVLGNEGPAGPRKQDVQQGTMFAAVELLYRLGVRWLWPDPTGHVIPKTPDVMLENIHYRHAPRVYDRGMRLQVGMGNFHSNVVAKYDRQPGRVDLHDWPLFLRLGGSRQFSAGHSFGDWYKRFFQTHPEYFARGPDGGFSWLHIPERAKLCVSNPAVLEQVVADAKAAYRAADNPAAATFSIMPNDGQGFCLCPACRAMDPAAGRPVSWNTYNSKTGKSEMMTHVSLSDRYATFWNKVAERLEKEAPGLTLGTCAYSVYRVRPLEVKKMHPNLAIGYVGGGYLNEKQREVFLQEWSQWSEICSQMFWRPNFMKEGEGFPMVWATRMGNDLKRLMATGCVRVDMPNVHHHWGTQGLNYYMLAQLMWDDTLEPSEVIDDYCRTGFGAAAPDVRRYVARLEELTQQFAVHQGGQVTNLEQAMADDEDPDARRVSGPKGGGPSAWDIVWTDAALLELDRLLLQAASSVEPGSPEAVRVAILREGLDYAKLEVRVRRAMDELEAAGSPDAEYELVLAVARVEQWLLAHRESKAIGVVEGAPYWWRGKRHVRLFNQQTIMGRAQHLAGNRYLLTMPAYSMKGRFVSIEFSPGGETWSAPQPYRIEHEYRAPDGAKAVYARLTFQGADGVKPQKPIKIELK